MYHCLHRPFVFCEKFSFFFFWFCFACSIWDLSSPTKDQTHASYIGSPESYHWTTMEDPMKSFLELIVLCVLFRLLCLEWAFCILVVCGSFLLWRFHPVGGVGRLICQGFLVREACVSVGLGAIITITTFCLGN